MKITVAVITPQDYEKFNAVGMNAEAYARMTPDTWQSPS